jgi:multiple sugar transport system substrate-binding protein
MTNDLLNRRFSTRNRIRAVPLAAAAFAAPTVLRHSTLAQQTEVRLAGWTSSDAEKTRFEQMLADLQTAHPEIKVNYEIIPSDYATKIQTDIAAGTVADVFYVDSLLAPDFMINQQLLELDSYMAADGVNASDFYPGLIGSFQSGGKTYGLPKDWSSLAMVYNSQALTDAGVAAAPKNWDELRAAAQTLADSTGEPRVCIPPDTAREFAFHYAAGGQIISDDGTKIVIDSPEGNTALDFYYGLYRDGLATTPADSGAGWPGDALAKGYADIVFEGNWVVPFMADSAPDTKVAFAEMPDGPAGKATLAFTVSFSAYAGTKVADGAWTVINYLTGPEGMKAWTDLGLAMPSRTSLADGWLQTFPDLEPFLKSGEYAHGWQLGPGGQAFYNDSTAEMQALFAGTQDVATTLQRLQSAAESRITLSGSPSASPAASPSPDASPSM